jgi:hypothetical protein
MFRHTSKRWLLCSREHAISMVPSLATNAPNVLILPFRIVLAWYIRPVGRFPRNWRPWL